MALIGSAAVVLGLFGSGTATAATASCNFSSGGFVHASDPHFASTGLALVRTEQTFASGSCNGGIADSSLTGVVRIIPELPASGPTTHNFVQQLAAHATGRARYGALGASVSTSASSTPMAYFYTDINGDGQATDNNYQVSAFASTNAAFTDELYVHAPAGAHPLTKVSVKFTGALSGGAHSAGLGGVEIQNASLRINQVTGIGGGIAFTTPGVLSSIVIDLYPMEAAPFLGRDPVVQLSGLLDISAYANAGMTLGCAIPGNIWCTTDSGEYGNYYANSIAVGEFNSTANFYVEILTAGATYASGSGVVYATGPATVPLPASLWLLGFAAVVMRRVAKRHVAVQ